MVIEVFYVKDKENKKELNTNIGIFEVSNSTYYNFFYKKQYTLTVKSFLYYVFSCKEKMDEQLFKFLMNNFYDLIINNIISQEFLKENQNNFFYYFDEFKLYEDKNILYAFFNDICLNNLSSKRYKKYFNELDYPTFLRILSNNINKRYNLIKIIDYFPLKYLVKRVTIEILSKSKYSFNSIYYFHRLKIENEDIEKVFSFISNIEMEDVKRYLKSNENEEFIDFLFRHINKNYFNNLSFSTLVISYKDIFKELVPLKIKRLLIDKICKRYKYDCLDLFQGDFHLLETYELIKLFSCSSFYKMNSCLQELNKKNHPILSKPDMLINLILKNPKILSFVKIEDISSENLNLILNKLNIDLNPKAKNVKVHQNIKSSYKFEYDFYEFLPNGMYFATFINMTFDNEIDKFLYNFLLYRKDIEIIYDNYYEKYKNLIIKKYGEEKFKKVDDIFNFLKFILAEKKVNNEIIMPNLEMIYQKLNLTNKQVEHIKDLMCSIDTSYNEKINIFLIRQRTLALSKYNAIVRMHLDGVNISEALTKIGLNKDELISQIIRMRNLDKKEKNTLINLLKEEKYILTIGDILGLLQEMEENDYTIDEVLRLNGVNKKYFYSIYKELIYTNLELHKKIKEALLNNKKRGFNKYIRLAYYLITLEFNDEEDFKNMFPNVDLDEMAINMEKLGKINLSRKLKEIEQNIKSKTKQIN